MATPPQKMKAYTSFADWKNDQSEQHKTVIGTLQRTIKKIAPHLTTSVKWGQGCFLNKNKPCMYIHTEPDYVQLGFYQGYSLNDPNKLLEGKGKFVRHIKIRSTKDIDENTFSFLIRQVTK